MNRSDGSTDEGCGAVSRVGEETCDALTVIEREVRAGLAGLTLLAHEYGLSPRAALSVYVATRDTEPPARYVDYTGFLRHTADTRVAICACGGSAARMLAEARTLCERLRAEHLAAAEVRP